MAQQSLHVVIAGGGISGLASAYYLQKHAQANNLPLSYTLVDPNESFGGKVASYTEDGFIIEGGPDSFITQKPWAYQLCQELGLGERLIGTNDDRRATYVVNKGRLTPLPDGMRLTVPTRIMPFALSPLFSPWGKLRAGMDLFIPPKKDDSDESVADFIGRRMGREMAEKLAEPLLAGIYIADPYRLSIKSTFPYYPAMEKQYGSLIKGILARMNAARKNGSAENKPKLSIFMTLHGGLTELIETLIGRLAGELLTGVALERFEKGPTGPAYQVHLSNGQTRPADAIILATPAYVSAKLLADHNPEMAEIMGGIRYLSSATVSLAFNKHEIEHPLNGFGFVVPKTEDCRLMACTWVSTKFDHRAPDDQALLRIFVGGYSREELVSLPDEELVSLVREELQQLMGIKAQPTRTLIYRWPRANPQYDVGHLDRIALVEQLASDSMPGLFMTGSAFRGVGLPDCIHQGDQAAEKAIAHLVKIQQQTPETA